VSLLLGVVLVCAAAIVAAAMALVTIATLVEILPPLSAADREEDEAPQSGPAHSRHLRRAAATSPAKDTRSRD